MAAEVDISTGIVISTAVDHFVDHFGRRYLKHPDSDKVIIGFAIPYWPSVIDTVVSCHKRLERIGYVGWDLSIMPDGRVSLIEGNSASGVDIQQSPGLAGKKYIYKQYL